MAIDPGTRPPAVSFGTREVAPPSPLYIGREDGLFVRSWNSNGAVRIAIRGRLLMPNGSIQIFELPHDGDGTRVRNESIHKLPEGFLLNLLVDPAAGGTRRGQYFLTVGLLRGRDDDVRNALLIAGYVTETEDLAWPGGQLHSSVEGPGIIRTILGTDPAAGVEITEVVPTNARWRLIAFRADLVTDATAANRRTKLQISDGTSITFQTVAASVQAASLTRRYTFAAGGFDHDVREDTYLLALPQNLMLLGGWDFNVDMVNLQAGDNWGAPRMLVEEWIEE